MKKIANIFFEKELFNHKKINWINYSFNIENCDLNLPTLVVGWKLFKSNFSYLYPDILNKNINKNYPKVGWEFSMDEKIVDHFIGIENFIKLAPKEFCNYTKYSSIDPISSNILNEYDIFNINEIFFVKNMSYYQYKNEIIYLYDKNKSHVYSIYLNAYKYFGFDIDKIIDLFNINFVNKIIDLDGMIYQSYYKEFPDFDQLKRSMILFLN